MNTKKNNLRKDERAVSPVIGVILMVAITVIMAAIIGAFVYGYAGSVVKTASPAFTVTRADAATVNITLANLGGASTITGLWQQAPNVLAVSISYPLTPGITGSTTAAAGDHLVVNGTVDGINKVVIDMMV